MKDIQDTLNTIIETQDRMLKKADSINEKLNEIQKIISQYPNDMELGKAIRKKYNEINKNENG